MGDQRFVARIDQLIKGTGTGKLTTRVVVDQVYAKIQHEALDFKHERGGEAKYLERGLFGTAEKTLQRLADATLHGPRALTKAAIKNAGTLIGEVAERAPLEFGDLRLSGQGFVYDQDEEVWHRPPIVHRLTAEELKAKDKMRWNGVGWIGTPK